MRQLRPVPATTSLPTEIESSAKTPAGRHHVSVLPDGESSPFGRHCGRADLVRGTSDGSRHRLAHLLRQHPIQLNYHTCWDSALNFEPHWRLPTVRRFLRTTSPIGDDDERQINPAIEPESLRTAIPNFDRPCRLSRGHPPETRVDTLSRCIEGTMAFYDEL
jgi:hypothetical protein